MTVGIFTTITNPAQRGDAYKEALACYEDFADELVVVNGGDTVLYDRVLADKKDLMSHWPAEFSWDFIGKQFQKGYEAMTTDFVIHMDIDFLFHQKDFAKIRQALKDYPNSPAVSFYKWQFILPDRYNLKSRLAIAVNKRVYGDRIKFNGGGDLCQPTLDGNDLELNSLPQAGIPFYNYEKLTKTKEQIMDDVGRMDRAFEKRFKKYLYSDTGKDEDAYEGWYRMVKGRASKPHKKIQLEDHPKYIQETIRNLKPNQFGYNGFGLIEEGVYA